MFVTEDNQATDFVKFDAPLSKVYHDTTLFGDGTKTNPLRVLTNNLVFSNTITSGGTTGDQTINKVSGTVNIAAAGTSVTVTNSLVTASSIIVPVIRTNDSTATIKNVTPTSGSFTIRLTAAATAETSIGFFVIN